MTTTLVGVRFLLIYGSNFLNCGSDGAVTVSSSSAFHCGIVREKKEFFTVSQVVGITLNFLL